MAIDPVAPDITPETEEQWETRSRFRAELLDALRDKLAAAEIQVTGGEDDGVTVVTHSRWRDAIREVDYAPLPPVDNHYAEVLTGAMITVWATCPRCGIAGPIMLLVDPELRVDTSGAELRLKAKAKPRTHICGQLTIPAAGPEVEGQESLNLEELIGPRCGKVIDVEADEVCHLPEGHDGECAPEPAEEVAEEPTPEAATPAEALSKTPEQAAANVSTKRARRRRMALAGELDDDLLPGEIRCEGSNHVPNCGHFDGPEFGDA